MIEWLTLEQMKERYPVSFDIDGFQKEIGVRLQLARKRAGLNQEAVAERLGIPRSTYANAECGRQRIATDLVWRAAIIFGVPMIRLVPERAGNLNIPDHA